MPANFSGEWHGGAIGHEGQQCGRSAERAAGNAVVTGPAPVFVLHARQVLANRFIPRFPLVSAGAKSLAFKSIPAGASCASRSSPSTFTAKPFCAARLMALLQRACDSTDAQPAFPAKVPSAF